MLNGGRIADLPLLRTVLAIRQNSQDLIFWDVMGSFVLLAYASLLASRTFLQGLLASLNLLHVQKIYSVSTNEKSNFYQLRQQDKQLKTMEVG